MRDQQRQVQEAERLKKLTLQREKQQQEHQRQIQLATQQMLRARHEENEKARLRQEKLDWYNSFENAMRAVPENAKIYAKSGSPGFEGAIGRVWGMNFPYSPNNYIDDPNLRNIMPVRRYGQDIIPGYNFQSRPFTG